MYEPPEYRRSQSVGVRGGGKTVDIPSDQLTTYGEHAEVGVERGETIKLGFDAVTSFDKTTRSGSNQV